MNALDAWCIQNVEKWCTFAIFRRFIKIIDKNYFHFASLHKIFLQSLLSHFYSHLSEHNVWLKLGNSGRSGTLTLDQERDTGQH